MVSETYIHIFKMFVKILLRRYQLSRLQKNVMHVFESFTFLRFYFNQVYLLVNITPLSIVLKISLCMELGWKSCVHINKDYFEVWHWRAK